MKAMTPFRPMFPMMGDLPLERMWRRFFDWEPNGTGGFQPAMNVMEKADAYVVTFELPGVEQRDIHVTLADNVLTVRGERRAEERTEGDNWHCQEATYGMFERMVTLPQAAADQDVDARLDHGMLKVQVAKRKEARRRDIPVKTAK